ncbi:MAG: hypothetical protein EON53_07650 [Actinomycetales bacterium]|nr:MAG: hypothetical protein EON53_07650 [Actinomycetales bacterium]
MEPTVAGEVLTAHPVAVLAIPAFIPVVVIVATVLWIARKDRLAEAAEHEAADPVAPVPPVPVPVSAADPTPGGTRGRPWRDRLPRLVIGDED